MNDPQTYLYAPEIELNTVSILWRRTDLLAQFSERCDPATHLTQPKLRIIYQAIRLAFGELGRDLNTQISPAEGYSDWPVVVSVVRELGYFDECGALAGLNEVYSAHEPGSYTNAIFADYLRLLCQYASARTNQVPGLRMFTGGKGVLEPNKIKRNPHDPDYTGAARIAGKSYALRAWKALDGSFVNFSLQPR